MTFKHIHALALQCVPHVALVIVVATKQVATRDREGNGSDTTTNLVVLVDSHLFISASVEQAARSVIRASSKSVTVGEVTEGEKKKKKKSFSKGEKKKKKMTQPEQMGLARFRSKGGNPYVTALISPS